MIMLMSGAVCKVDGGGDDGKENGVSREEGFYHEHEHVP